jgi:AcrR family transcriptional regulator
MERTSRDVKLRGRYDSTRRREQARATRAAILDAARRRFLDEGFAATTVASLAADAGVSVDTIYKSYGGKAGLVRAIHEQALAGEGPVHAEARSDALQRAERDPLAIIRAFGDFVIEIAPRTAPIMLLIRDAAISDPEMAELQAELDAERLRRMIHNAENLRNAGHLRADLSVEAAGEIGWLYTAPQLYELLVIKRGWSIQRFGAFVGDALAAAYLSPDVVVPGTPRPKRKPKR